MKLVNVVQGTPEWLEARLGIPTASGFDRIITPKTLKLSAESAGYRNELLAEWLLGCPLDFAGKSDFMTRGQELEPEARAWYEMQHSVDVEQVGLILREDGLVGGSPDGLIGLDGGLEIKCPSIQAHVGYMLNPDSLVAKYRCQVQGYMYLTDREWWDAMSYNPSLPRVVRRVERDEAFIKALHDALAWFLADLDDCKAALAQHRVPSLELIAA